MFRYVKDIWRMIVREAHVLVKNRIYGFCMVVFPLLVVFFFTSLLEQGQPQELPVGVVDLDNTSTTRGLTKSLDAFQTSCVIAHYPNVAEARRAIQENHIYGFIYFPKGTTDALLSNRQPKISFYYTMTTMTAGSVVYKDMKTISTLGSAAVGQATLKAHGATDGQIQTLLQPIRIDLHQINNPWTNYNVYLSTMMVPGLMMLFMFLISAYSLGTELKFDTGKEWVTMADGNMLVAIVGKFMLQTIVFLTVVLSYEYYVFGHLGFPHPGGWPIIVLLAVLQVAASQGFGIFAFGLMPSLRMSMSVCSLWAVLSFSMAGSAFPLMAMDGPLKALAWLFPLRHYFMIYQTCLFNGYPLYEAWFHLAAMVAFTILPWLVLKKIKNAMLTYVYIP